MIFILSLFSGILVSLISLLGIFLIALKTKLFESLIYYLVAFAGGVLFGAVFFHILPETVKEVSITLFSIMLLVGFVSFFILERLLRWRHCHLPQCEIHPLAHLNLIGDGLHNFVDGLLISGAYLLNIETGVFVTLAIVAHEIPQEIGDFSLLVYSGVKKRRALFYNFLISTLAILGVLIGFFFFSYFKNLLPHLLAFAGGNFLYIATSDIIPELHREVKLKRALISFLFFLIGLSVIILLSLLFHHS